MESYLIFLSANYSLKQRKNKLIHNIHWTRKFWLLLLLAEARTIFFFLIASVKPWQILDWAWLFYESQLVPHKKNLVLGQNSWHVKLIGNRVNQHSNMFNQCEFRVDTLNSIEHGIACNYLMASLAFVDCLPAQSQLKIQQHNFCINLYKTMRPLIVLIGNFIRSMFSPKNTVEVRLLVSSTKNEIYALDFNGFERVTHKILWSSR